MKHATSNGVDIHYQDTGAGAALLVLNGWTASGLIWPAAWVAELDRHFRVLRICNRGTGHSGRVTAGFSMGEMAADAVAVLDAEGIDVATVFGLSMGGMIAQTVAFEAPDRVAGLVLCATRPPAPEQVDPPPEVLASLMAPADPGPRDQMITRMWSSIVGPGFVERDAGSGGGGVLDALVAGVLAKPTSLEVIGMQMQAIAGFGDAKRLASLRVPTLVIHGEADPLLPVENGRRLAKLIPGARYEERPGVGHLVPWEEPEHTARLMVEVLV